MSSNTSQNIRLVDFHGDPTGKVVSDLLVNCYSSLTVPAYWRALNFIALNMARFPRRVHDPRAAADAPPHPLTRMLHRKPNQYQNPFVFWSTLFYHHAHTGNAYARIERGAAMRPTAIHNIKPENVTPFRFIAEGAANPEQFYLLKDSKEILHGTDVIHLRGLSWDGQRGIDPVDLHSSTLNRASVIDRYQTKFLQSGTVVRGSIEFPGEVPDDRLEVIKNYLRQSFYGMEAEEDVLILTMGAQLKNATLDPQKAQMVEQSRHSTKQISQITGVPPEFLFELSEAKYNAAIELAGEWVVRYCFGPLIEQTEDELAAKLLTDAELDAGLTVKLNPDALVRGSTLAQMQVVKLGVDSAIYLPNEGREMLGKPPLDDPEANKLKRSGDTSTGTPNNENTPPPPGPNA